MIGARRKNRNKQKGRLFGVFFVVFGFFLSFSFFFVSAGALYISYVSTQLPTSAEIQTKRAIESTKLFDRTGKTLLYEIHGEEKRTVVPFTDVPLYLREATLAAEDSGFYEHPAFNWKTIARAFLINLKERRLAQGGSTITQQLAKNMFLSPERTITRKLKEFILAMKLESRYSKDEILSLYLNQIPYGSNAYGVEAAAQTFFGKRVTDISLSEAAVLAGLPKAPSYYSPWGNHLSELMDRQKYILGRMAELGFITVKERDGAIGGAIFQKKPIALIKAYHFSLAVRDYLVEKYGEDLVSDGGLKVITTLDARLQAIAERAVSDGAKRNSELYEGRNSALVAEDPKTGQVLALVGSKDPFGEPEPKGCRPGINCLFDPDFDVATRGLRQPGSALKPFAYLTAISGGYSQDTVVYDVPTEFSTNPICPTIPDFSDTRKECFHPRNFDDRFRGEVSFAEGLSQSINVPSVKALYLAGFDNVLGVLKKFGITTLGERARYGLSLVLGGGEVRLVQLVNAYAALANGGVLHNQKFILRVEDREGKVLEQYEDETKRAVGSQYARVISGILADKELRSGLFHSSLGLTVFSGRDVALKTGTTNDYRDAWAMGYTPSLAVGVWAGNNDNTPMQRKGGSILASVPIWSAFLKEALSLYPPEFFPFSEPDAAVSKPMLNGDGVYRPVVSGAVYPQIHSILYYVKKDDPLGPYPANPYNDYQYNNWEQGVRVWAQANVSGFNSYNQPLPAGAVIEEVLTNRSDISVRLISPEPGAAVFSPFQVKTEIVSRKNLKGLELYLNGERLAEMPISGTSYSFNWFVFEPILQNNTIEIKARDVSGAERAGAVVFTGR